jgi:hypothetical protein
LFAHGLAQVDSLFLGQRTRQVAIGLSLCQKPTLFSQKTANAPDKLLFQKLRKTHFQIKAFFFYFSDIVLN